jgi:hypothetical protein
MALLSNLLGEDPKDTYNYLQSKTRKFLVKAFLKTVKETIKTLDETKWIPKVIHCSKRQIAHVLLLFPRIIWKRQAVVSQVTERGAVFQNKKSYLIQS